MLIEKGKPLSVRVFSLIGGFIVFLFFHNSGINQKLAGSVETPELAALVYAAAGLVEINAGYLISCSIFRRIYKLNAEKPVKAALSVFVTAVLAVVSVTLSAYAVNKPVQEPVVYSEDTLRVRLALMAAETARELPVTIQKDFLVLDSMRAENLSLIYNYVFNISDKQAERLNAEGNTDENLKRLMFLGEGNDFCDNQAELLAHGVSFVALYSTAQGTEFAQATVTKDDCGF